MLKSGLNRNAYGKASNEGLLRPPVHAFKFVIVPFYDGVSQYEHLEEHTDKHGSCALFNVDDLNRIYAALLK